MMGGYHRRTMKNMGGYRGMMRGMGRMMSGRRSSSAGRRTRRRRRRY